MFSLSLLGFSLNFSKISNLSKLNLSLMQILAEIESKNFDLNFMRKIIKIG